MQIQRVQTGSETTNVAGQVQRGARGHHTKAVDQAAVDADAADVASIDAGASDTPAIGGGAVDSDLLAAITNQATRNSGDASDAQAPTSSKKLHPRLAAYAQRIEGRLAHAADSRDLTPRQQAAIQQAQTQFHGLIQRLDDAYSSNASMDKKKPMIDSLTAMIDHLTQSVNHIQSGGPLDITG
jgi:hypothetical protein